MISSQGNLNYSCVCFNSILKADVEKHFLFFLFLLEIKKKQVKWNSILLLQHCNINRTIQIVFFLVVYPLHYMILDHLFLKVLFWGESKHHWYFSIYWFQTTLYIRAIVNIKKWIKSTHFAVHISPSIFGILCITCPLHPAPFQKFSGLV